MGAWVYRFGGGAADGNAGMRALLGGKGANLAEMAAIGLPVPPGFTITTALCNSYYDAGRTLPAGLDAEIEAGLAHIEGIAGAGFGDPDHTLARLGPLRRPRVDARHDGYRPQSRPQR